MADVRVADDASWHDGVLGVVAATSHFGAITGSRAVTSGAFSFADVRLANACFRGSLGVVAATDPFGTITGKERPSSGAFSFADFRLRAPANHGCYGVFSFTEQAGTITGNVHPGGSTCNLADTRLPALAGRDWHHSVMRVTPWHVPAGTITGANRPAAGSVSVGDTRVAHDAGPREAASIAVFTGETTTGVHRLFSGSTPRNRPTVPWSLPGVWWASDCRVPSNPRLAVRWVQADLDDAPPYLPVFAGRGDGSWHRPITLLERAALQGIPSVIDGAPLELDGTFTQIARHIGNAVPVGAAQQIAVELLKTMVLASTGAFQLSLTGTEVWVKRRRDGSFPLYLEQELKRVSKRSRRQARAVVSRINVSFLGAETPCAGAA